MLNPRARGMNARPPATRTSWIATPLSAPSTWLYLKTHKLTYEYRNASKCPFNLTWNFRQICRKLKLNTCKVPVQPRRQSRVDAKLTARPLIHSPSREAVFRFVGHIGADVQEFKLTVRGIAWQSLRACGVVTWHERAGILSFDGEHRRSPAMAHSRRSSVAVATPHSNRARDATRGTHTGEEAGESVARRRARTGDMGSERGPVEQRHHKQLNR